jgi:hypothetical protein
MTAPQRIQRQRTKGWKMPPNTVYVGRPTIWGNHHSARVLGHSLAVHQFRRDLAEGKAGWPGKGLPLSESMIQVRLRGKNLACWCAPGLPCHADVLLEIANR